MRPYILIYVFIFLLFGIKTLAQSNIFKNHTHLPDTIWVTNYSSLYLAFPKDVDLINIGSPDYVFQVEKTIVYLKAIKINAKPTNMLVKCGNGLWVTNLVFQTKPKISLYDFRKINFENLNQTELTGNYKNPELITDQPTINSVKSQTNPSALSVENKLKLIDTTDNPFGIPIQRLSSLPDRFKTFGTAQNQITILLTDILTDTKRMLLKFKIINRSSLSFTLDYVSFQFHKKIQYLPTTILSPLYASKISTCGPKSMQILIYILPLFGPSAQGSFSATFRELNGDRKETIEIPERAFKMAKIL